MRLDVNEHKSKPWKMHGILDDFNLDEVWRYPFTACPEKGETFQMFCRAMENGRTPKGVAGALVRFRSWLGTFFGWDKKENTLPIPGCSEHSLRARLPEAESKSDRKPEEAFGFRLVYEDSQERLMELSNQTVHAAVHLGWVEGENGKASAEMAVYWKPRGCLGRIYMGLIYPFRRWVVYPALMVQAERNWKRAQERMSR